MEREKDLQKIFRENRDFVAKVRGSIRDNTKALPQYVREDIESIMHIAETQSITLIEIYRDYNPDKLI